MQYRRGYLDFLFTELAIFMFKSFRLLPGALSSLQVIVVVISVLDGMFYPNTISAAWRKAESAPLDTANVILNTKSENLVISHCVGISFLNPELPFL